MLILLSFQQYCASGKGATKHELTKSIQEIVANQKAEVKQSERAAVHDRLASEAAGTNASSGANPMAAAITFLFSDLERAGPAGKKHLAGCAGLQTPCAVMSPTPPLPSCNTQSSQSAESIVISTAVPCVSTIALRPLRPLPCEPPKPITPCVLEPTMPTITAVQQMLPKPCPKGSASAQGSFCSYHGACDNRIGRCLCELGYSGPACELRLQHIVPAVAVAPISMPQQEDSASSSAQAVLINPYKVSAG